MPTKLRSRICHVDATSSLGRGLLASLAVRRRLRVAPLYHLLCLVALCATSPAYSTEDDWTVVTIARDGSWGIGTAGSQNRAIAGAVRDCKAMATTPNDCGALLKATRGGWIVAELCGDQKILATAATREEAEQAALHREIDLELFYVTPLPPCSRLVTIAPRGTIVASDLAYSRRW